MNVEQLVARIENLDRKLDGYVSGSAAQAATTSAELRAIGANVKRVGDQVETINKYLHVGNGKPAVTSRLDLVEHKVGEAELWIEHHDEVQEADVRERAKEARTARSQFVGIVLAGIFSLAAAGVALLRTLP